MNELFDYWNEFPPAHELLIILTGYKPANGEKKLPEGALDPLAFARLHKAKPRKRKPNG